MMKIDLGTYIVKLLKTKDKGTILKATWGKQRFTYRGTMNWMITDFSSEILEARGE